MKAKAGYQGKDAMREKAEKAFKGKAKSAEKPVKLKKGGTVTKKASCESAKTAKYAMGGVGKIRHKQSTASGKPIGSK